MPCITTDIEAHNLLVLFVAHNLLIAGQRGGVAAARGPSAPGELPQTLRDNPLSLCHKNKLTKSVKILRPRQLSPTRLPQEKYDLMGVSKMLEGAVRRRPIDGPPNAAGVLAGRRHQVRAALFLKVSCRCTSRFVRELVTSPTETRTHLDVHLQPTFDKGAARAWRRPRPGCEPRTTVC